MKLNFKIFFGTALLTLTAFTAEAAPLWNSVVLDDFSNNVTFNLTSGTGQGSYSFATENSPGITGRRDISLLYATSGSYSGSGAEINSAGNGSFTYSDVAGLGTAPTGFANQYDYGTLMNGIDPLTGLDTGTPTATLASYWSKYVLDLGTIVGTYDVTFFVMGDTAADYATASQIVNAGDSDSLVEFDRQDFYDDLNGDFDNPLAGASWITWAPYVTSFGFTVTTATSTNTNSFELNEVYATIPEPSSMLAMAGLFGGAGLVGFRRKRAARKIANA